MAYVTYKQRCMRCKTNYVLSTWKDKFPVCFECQKPELEKEVTDPQMKMLFDIPLAFYEKSNFLRDIKIKYLRFGSLTDRQIEAFKKTVKAFQEKSEGDEEEGITKKKTAGKKAGAGKS